MFGSIGFIELVLIFVIALVVIGPQQLPAMARTVGKLINEFKRATGGISKDLFEFRDATARFVQETKDEVEQKVKLGIQDPLNDVVQAGEHHAHDDHAHDHHVHGDVNEPFPQPEGAEFENGSQSTAGTVGSGGSENLTFPGLDDDESEHEPVLQPYDPFAENLQPEPELEPQLQSQRSSLADTTSGPPGSSSRGTSPHKRATKPGEPV